MKNNNINEQPVAPSAPAVPVAPVVEEYPVKFDVEYPEHSSRLLALFGIIPIKMIALVPHLIVMWALSIASAFIAWISFWAILFTGRYPKSFFNFVVGVTRWQNRINVWASSLTDKYPPFTLK